MVSEDSPQERITSFWSATAADYDAHAGNVPDPGSREHAAWVEAIRDALPPAPADVLDIGTGTGFAAIVAAGFGHRVTGLDLSGPMLETARAKAVDAGLSIRFIEGDAVEPPFPRESFDVVMSRHFIWTLREPGRAFVAWHHLLRPGGRFIATHSIWKWDEAPPTDDEPGLFERHYNRETRAALPGMSFRSMDDWVALVEECGFADVTVLELAAVAASAPDQPTPSMILARRL